MNGTLLQKDMRKENKLPSLPCVLHYYPEYHSMTDIQREMLGIETTVLWEKETAINAGKKYMLTHDFIGQKDLKSVNGLPSNKVIKRLFGSLRNFQEAVGAPVSKANEFITKEELHAEVENFFYGREKIVENQVSFQKEFKYKLDIIRKRYGSFEDFCKIEGIKITNPKKARYTKREVDDAISNWILQGNDIPRIHDLTKLGLPSQAVILRFYDNWKEPFIIYQKLHEEIGRVKPIR